MIALDTNILVYARREEAPHHERARELLIRLAEGDSPWAVPWPCIYEFVRVVTHPRVFDPPTPLESVLEDLDSLMQSPSLSLIREGPRHATFMQRLLKAGQAAGNLAHDAHIAAASHSRAKVSCLLPVPQAVCPSGGPGFSRGTATLR